MKTGNLNGVDLTSSGAGTNYLADDGTYKAVSGGGSQDLQSVLDTGNTADKEINLERGNSSTLTEFLKFRLLDGSGEVKMRFENALGVYQMRFGGSTLRDLYFSNFNGDNFVIRSGTSDESFIAKLKATFEDVAYFESTTNSSPVTGEVWNNGTDLEIEAPIKVNGDAIFNEVGGTTTLKVGDDTDLNTAGENGLKLMANSNGSVYLDHKTASGDTIFYRCGENTEQGNARIFMQVDPTNGYVTFPTNVNVGGSLDLSDVLNLASTTNASPSDGDVWRDSASGKLKFRENGVTYNFN